ncbi:MAG: hypothetical protein AAF236_15500, partial [Verrucomicrobiota bacterium]
IEYQRAGHFWVWIMAVTELGHMRRAWCGKVEGRKSAQVDGAILHAWDRLDALQLAFEVEDIRVCIDAGTDAIENEIYFEAAKRNWLCLAGSGQKQHLEKSVIQNDGTEILEKVASVFSGFKAMATFPAEVEGDPDLVAELVHWNKKSVTDFWDVIRTGRSAYVKLSLPRNIYRLEKGLGEMETIYRQLNSMVYDARKGQWVKKTASTQDHLWDCCSMIIVMMLIDGYFSELTAAHKEEATRSEVVEAEV